MIKNLLIIALLFFILLSIGLGTYIYFRKPECPPATVVAKGHSTYITPTPTHTTDTVYIESKPTLKRKITNALGITNPNTHKVKSGETMYHIANRLYNIPTIDLMNLNKRTTFDLRVGDILYVGTAKDRDSIRAQYGDTTRATYTKAFGDSVNIKGSVTTEVVGRMLSQDIHYELLGKYKPRNTLGVGTEIGLKDRSVNGLVNYRLKTGWTITGEIGITQEDYRVGITKDINF